MAPASEGRVVVFLVVVASVKQRDGFSEERHRRSARLEIDVQKEVIHDGGLT